MFSTMPSTGTRTSRNICKPLRASTRLTSCGVVTITAPDSGAFCVSVSGASAVPGGRSTPREPNSRQRRVGAIRWRMFGRLIFGGGPGGCMAGSFVSGVGAGGRRRELAKVFQRKDAGVVAVAPDDFVGVAADARHGDRGQRHQFFGLEQAERV